ncbi:DUF294 nucleotidyltransferase-like domain-containing protein [Alkalicoccus urumqiensis]|uniref:Cyclic nucleotide-binding domain-containing protein n=1 Tax=Alkalicoccus urumqiensis TaxID=1548213 RepID=A0A2P6MDR4_ALKUR|nr:DUF294 nucleotidyltransferase-like domain-containing protein [Alkalicoccus urumqiensis]PRO64431.1 hypothetical protein C6I21_14615 [Alkalicoccus urumqiensis]
MKTNNVDISIRNMAPFSSLTDEEFDRLTAVSQWMRADANEFLFHEEEEDVEVYFLLEGLCKNVLHREDGRAVSVRFYYPGDLIGLMILFSGGKMTFSVEALEPSVMLKLSKKTVLQLMEENQAFRTAIHHDLGESMKSLYHELKQETGGNEENFQLFRTKVRSLMTHAPTIPDSQEMSAACRRLASENLEGLVLVTEEGAYSGVLTQRGALKCAVSGRMTDAVSQWKQSVPSVEEDTFTYEVLTYFKDDHIELIPVVHGVTVVGMLTAESFLQLQDSEYLQLAYELQHAQSFKEAASASPKVNQTFHAFTRSLLTEGIAAGEVSEFLSSYNDQIHRRIIQLAVRSMQQDGYGLPPVNYCFIVMGSQGRMEQGFSTDQDNGLILADYRHLENKNDIEDYFHRFAARVNDGLVQAGFPECTGGIMARERRWCREVSEWKREVVRWIKESDSREIRDFTIFIDYRPVFGDYSLAEELRTYVLPHAKEGRLLHAMLMKDTLRFRVPVNALGRFSFRSRRSELDIKKQGLMQIVNGVRISAMQYGIEAVSTKERLLQLEKLEVFHPRDVRNILTALDVLHQFRIELHLNQLRDERPLTNQLLPLEMEKDDRKRLKEALVVAKRLQQMFELSFQKSRGIS